MKKYLFLFCLAATIMIFHGCASKQVSAPVSGQTSAGVAAGGQPSGIAGEKRGGGGAITEEELSKAERERRARAAEEAAATHLQDIYFNFDSYAIRMEDMPLLKKMTDWLVRNQAMTLTIEGYCDERGTTEYNLALGQKRAEAAKDYFVASGVGARRLTTVSYGKEAPIDPGHTEDAWAKNRRVHFVGK